MTRYLAAEGGEFVAEVPARCVASTAANGADCSITIHCRRIRKTGPSHPLAVARCKRHEVTFTLYPPGYVPYGRAAIAPIDGECQVLHEATDCAAGNDSPKQLAWNATIFRAALDGRAGLAWPRESCRDAFGSWRTQGRWLAFIATWLGLTYGDDKQWSYAGPLGVPTLTLREASAGYGSAKGYVARGRAVALVVDALSALTVTGRQLLDLLLVAGFVAGLWGTALRWDARTETLHDVTQSARPP
jgi:hypothetical protein